MTSNKPDVLIEDGNVQSVDSNVSADWIVRLERRDVECQFRFVDHHGNINSRLSSAMRLNKEDARQFAKVITEQHPKYKARAMLYATMRKKKEAEK